MASLAIWWEWLGQELGVPEVQCDELKMYPVLGNSSPDLRHQLHFSLLDQRKRSQFQGRALLLPHTFCIKRDVACHMPFWLCCNMFPSVTRGVP